MWRKKKSNNPSVRALDLKVVGQKIRERIERIQRQKVQPALVIARLADAYRDVGVRPLPPIQVQTILDELDEEGWRRLDLVVSVLANEAISDVLRNVTTENDIADQIRNIFLPLVEKKQSVTLAMENGSPLRIEEFARHLATGLKVSIRGETMEQSAERLARLDYERLLIDAEISKLSGKERADYFIALHRAERGKW